ncbi:MAG: hypothetical protein VXZ82_20645 [Planctomycetota bacterium]|nr:hypothetical protein [Planctomycetota bacterium]
MDSTAEWFECVWESEGHAESTIQNFLEHNMDQVASLLRQNHAPSNLTASTLTERGIQSADSQVEKLQVRGAGLAVEPTEQEMSETLSELLALQESLNALLAQHEQGKATEGMEQETKELLRRKAEEKETVG